MKEAKRSVAVYNWVKFSVAWRGVARCDAIQHVARMIVLLRTHELYLTSKTSTWSSRSEPGNDVLTNEHPQFLGE
jgi:hypothetical protein